MKNMCAGKERESFASLRGDGGTLDKKRIECKHLQKASLPKTKEYQREED